MENGTIRLRGKIVVNNNVYVILAQALSEQGRLDTEGPRQRVHIGAFDVSKSPVTRGQWRMHADTTGIRERVNGGIARAKRQGTKSGRKIGRPELPTVTANAIRTRRAEGENIRAIAKKL
jgi:formylglycine-generating enzyme required for sulfatase activity